MKFPAETSNTVRLVMVVLLTPLRTREKQTVLFQHSCEMEKTCFLKAVSWSHMHGSAFLVQVPRI